MSFSPGTRRRRPLYPMAWGAGKKAFEATYKCYSVAAAGRDDLENGDKILMPEKAFREVSRLRLQFPITFTARNTKKSGPPSQSRGTAVRGRRSKIKTNTRTVKEDHFFLEFFTRSLRRIYFYFKFLFFSLVFFFLSPIVPRNISRRSKITMLMPNNRWIKRYTL